MTRNKTRLAAVVPFVIVTMILALAFSACSKGPKEGAGGPLGFWCKYQADITQSIVKGGVTNTVMTGNIATNCELTRMENKIVQPGVPAYTMIFIRRPDLGVNWQLFPKSMKYIETPIKPETGLKEAPLMAQPKDVKVDKENLGAETVDGHPCIKWKVTLTHPDGKQDTYYAWSATDLKDLVIKQEFETTPGQTYVMQLTNITIGDPAKETFEIPAGYTKAPESEMNALMMNEMGISIPGGIPIPKQ